MKLVLEPRHLFDGSLHAVTALVHDSHDSHHEHHDGDHHASHAAAPAAGTTPTASTTPGDRTAVPAFAPKPQAHEILFVDPRVADWQSLASSVGSDVQVIVIDPSRDGLDQVTDALQGRTGITSIQFLTYGQPGGLELGNSMITAATLASHQGEVASWGDHLAAGADIQFWGCDVGQGGTGQAFVDSMHTLTGAQIGASTDPTGAAVLGGDWVLEDTSGTLHSTAVFSASAMAGYQHVLDANTPSLLIIGEANNTNNTGTGLFNTGVSSVNATIGDIVRYSASVQIPEGTTPDVRVTVNLPVDMQFMNDGTITIMLVSPDGSITATNFGSAASASYGGASFDPAQAKATLALPASQIAVNPDGTVTFDLGSVTDNEGTPLQPKYAIIQFSAIVSNQASAVDHASLAANAVVGDVNVGEGIPSANATVIVLEPHVVVTKTVTSIVNSNGSTTINISETVTNSGAATAYNVVFDDPEGSNTGLLSGVTQSGSGSLTRTSGNGTTDLHATGSLGPGASNTFIYTETVSDPALGVSTATAKVTYTSLSNTVGGSGGETLAGTLTGISGSATGSRDGTAAPLSANNYASSVSMGFGVVSGHVWNDIGPDATQFGEAGSHDTNLAGVTVTGVFGGVTETAVTDANGSYSMLVLAGAGTIALPTAGAGGLPATETLTYNDGHALTSPATVTANAATPITAVNFSFKTPDTAPTITGFGSGNIAFAPVASGGDYTVNGPGVLLATGGAIADTEIDQTGGSYQGSVLTFQRYNGDGTPHANVNDIFFGSGALLLSGGVVNYGGATVGTFTQSGGVLKITFGTGGASAAMVGNVLNAITYSNFSTGASSGIKIGVTLDDHNQAQAQGTGGNKVSAPVFVTVNEIAAPVSTSYTEPNGANLAGAAVALQPSLQIVNAQSANPDTFDGATVTIAGAGGEDQLSFTSNSTTMGDISGSFSNGVLTLTSAGGVTAAQLQAALQAVKYFDNSDTPTIGARTLTFQIHDRTSNATTTAALATVTVNAANDSPILNGNPVTLSHAAEDGGDPNGQGAIGASVLSLTGGNVTDTDGADAHAGDTPGALGIAITDAATGQGNWWYSTDNGAHWTEFAGVDAQGNAMTAISASNALHLVADGNTRIYFESTAANTNGTITNAIAFRGWDRFDGVANGVLSALPSGLGSGVNTAGSAYTSAAQSVALVIDSVNDAPLASGAAALTNGADGNANPAGDSVSHLFGSNFNDSADQQQSGANPASSVADTFAGIAITGNAAGANQGAWQYSADGGNTWIAIPASGLANGNALVISATDNLRFIPSAGFAGTPGALSVHLIDTSAGPVSSAGAMVNLNTLGVGGATAFSAATVSLSAPAVAAQAPPAIPPTPTPIIRLPILSSSDPFEDLGAGNAPTDHFIRVNGLSTDSFSDQARIQQFEQGSATGNPVIVADGQGVIHLPPNLFGDTAGEASLDFDVRGPDGGPVPAWLEFNAREMTFSGTPPAGAHGTVNITITARDAAGNRSAASFRIQVGSAADGLQRLLTPEAWRQAEAAHAPAKLPAATHTPPREHARPAHGQVHGHHAHVAAADATPPGRNAFSAQLNSAGQMGRLSEARALLEAIEKIIPIELIA